MSTHGKKPPGGGPLDDDEDFTAIDEFGPMVDSANSDAPNVASTRMVRVDQIPRENGITVDRARARALNVSMATTLIEPLPQGTVASVELPNGSKVVLNKSVTVLGRANGASDILVDDIGVSRQHAAIVYAQGEFFLEDLGSSNGTRVNGEKIGVAALSPGVEFSLGRNMCRFNVRKV